MKYPSLALGICLFTLCLPGVAFAQLGPLTNQGFASALAHGHSLDSSVAPGHFGLFLKPPAHQPLIPIGDTYPVFQDGASYSLDSLFGDFAPFVDINGHSTGSDDIADFVEGAGTPTLDGGRWMHVTVSFDNSATGLPGSLIRRRTNVQGGRTTPGSDLIGYYFSDSAAIDQSYIGSTFLEQAAEDIGYSVAQDIDALDWSMGVMGSSSASSWPAGLFSGGNAYYFSITQASAEAINQQAGSLGFFAKDAGGNSVRANAATIYLISWEPSSNGQPPFSWNSEIVEYQTASELQLDLARDDVDALAVNASTGVTIFSTRIRPEIQAVPQLQVYQTGWRAPEALKDNGVPVTSKIGSSDDTDDIDSVAIIDPEIDQADVPTFASHLASPGPVDGLGGVIGSAQGPDTMGLSVTRGRWVPNRVGVDEYHFAQVSGWGYGHPVDGTIRIYQSFDYQPYDPGAGATWQCIDSKPRFRTDSVTNFRLPLPSGPSIPNEHLAIAYRATFIPNQGLTSTTNSVTALIGSPGP